MSGLNKKDELQVKLNEIADIFLELLETTKTEERRQKLKDIVAEFKVAKQLLNDSCQNLIVGKEHNDPKCTILNNALADLIKIFNETPVKKPINTPPKTELTELIQSIKHLRSGEGGRRKRKTHRKRKALRKTRKQ